MAVDITKQASSLFSGVNVSGLGSILLYGFIIILICVITGFIVYRIMMNRRFNKSITFFRRNPQTKLLVPDRTIKAMLIRIDKFGNLAYRLKTPYETKNQIQKLHYEGKPNAHYVEYTRDGKIVEIIGFGDYDDTRKEIKSEFIDDNTELARSSLHQMNKERYEKTSFWKEHATLLVNIGAMVVIMIFLYLIADKLIGILGSINDLLTKMQTLQTGENNIINSINNLLTAHNIAPA